MDGVDDIRINVLRKNVYEQLLEELQDKFTKSKFADNYIARYRIKTDRIPKGNDEDNEAEYYDEFDASEGSAQEGNNIQPDNAELNSLGTLNNNHIEQAIIDIFEYAYDGMDEYALIVRLINQELSKLIILPVINGDTIKAEIVDRVRVFERLNEEGFIRDNKEISEYIKHVKSIDCSSKSIVNKVSKRDIDIVDFGFYNIKPESNSLTLSYQINYGDPYIHLVNFTLAIFLYFISHGVEFTINSQGTQRHAKDETQITSFARFIHAVVHTPIYKLQHPDFTGILNGILKGVTGKDKNSFILDAVVKIKYKAIRHNMKVSSLVLVKDYFRPSDMFGFNGLKRANKKPEIAKKIELTLGLTEDVLIVGKSSFQKDPLKYLNNSITRLDS